MSTGRTTVRLASVRFAHYSHKRNKSALPSASTESKKFSAQLKSEVGAKGGIGPTEDGRVCDWLRSWGFPRDFGGSVLRSVGPVCACLAASVSYSLAVA